MDFPPSIPPGGSTSPFLSFLGGLTSTPSKWTKNFQQTIRNRFDNRVTGLQSRIDDVVQGRVVPDIDDLSIGSGSQCNLAILFLDICNFSDLPNWSSEEQKAVLALMHLFMSEMITLVRDFGGHFEKNTGDGLMAYFSGVNASTDSERVKPAVEAAAAMHYFNDNMLGPFLDSQYKPRLRFRVGIDVGPVTIARIGAKSSGSEYNSVVAIGTTANVACKLMKLIPEGGICLGEKAYQILPNNWTLSCTKSSSSTGFVYVATGQPYPAWVMHHRLSSPLF